MWMKCRPTELRGQKIPITGQHPVYSKQHPELFHWFIIYSWSFADFLDLVFERSLISERQFVLCCTVENVPINIRDIPHSTAIQSTQLEDGNFDACWPLCPKWKSRVLSILMQCKQLTSSRQKHWTEVCCFVPSNNRALFIHIQLSTVWQSQCSFRRQCHYYITL